jgi:hypothetical protein
LGLGSLVFGIWYLVVGDQRSKTQDLRPKRQNN